MTKAQHYLNPNYESKSKSREAQHFYVKEYNSNGNIFDPGAYEA